MKKRLFYQFQTYGLAAKESLFGSAFVSLFTYFIRFQWTFLMFETYFQGLAFLPSGYQTDNGIFHTPRKSNQQNNQR